METITNVSKLESLKSMQSSIRKMEKALTQMTQKGANTTLVEKRLIALQIGLAVLECAWNDKPHSYTRDDLAAARETLNGLCPSLEAMYAKLKPGSPQITLLKRRIAALEQAVQEINGLLDHA